MSSSGEERIKKRKKSSPVVPQISSLPDDLLLSCFARVSRLYYPTLSLVSKSFRSLLASPELYQTRSVLGRTESCLYVCLQFPTDPKPRWFTLCRRPNKALTNDTRKKKKKKSNGNVFAEIPSPQSPNAHWSGVVAIGCNIYTIGGSMYNSISSSVSILDCRSHTWHEAPSMRVKRNYASVSVLDGKIYVKGGSKECDSSNLSEVFDPKEGRWDMVGSEMEKNWLYSSRCVINNVLYSYYLGDFKWYDTKVRLWKKLKGLVGLPKFARYASVKLADYGGKMAVLWDKYLTSSAYQNKRIWCSEIALERHNNDEEIWGKVEWCDAVFTVPISYKFEYALAATV